MTDKTKFANIAVTTDKAVLNKDIASLKNRGKRFDSDFHKAAVSCLYHAMAHGDSGALGDLRMAMPASGNRKKLDMWILAHAPYKTDDQDKLVVNQSGVPILKKSRKPEDFLMEKCAETTYYDYKPETPKVEWSLDVVMAKLEKQLGTKVDKDVITASQKAAIMTGFTNALLMEDVALAA